MVDGYEILFPLSSFHPSEPDMKIVRVFKKQNDSFWFSWCSLDACQGMSPLQKEGHVQEMLGSQFKEHFTQSIYIYLIRRFMGQDDQNLTLLVPDVRLSLLRLEVLFHIYLLSSLPPVFSFL